MTALPDIPRLYTALAEWLACTIYLLVLPRRFGRGATAVLGAGWLAVLGVFLQLTGAVPLAWWIPCMAGAVAMMFLYLYSGAAVSARVAGYHCARAFLAAEFAASLEWQLHCLLWPRRSAWDPAALALLALVYGGLHAVLYRLEARRPGNTPAPVITGKAMASAVVMAAAAFAVSNFAFAQQDEATMSVFYIRTLVDLGGIAILYAYHLQRAELQVRHELETMDSILRSQYAQYQQSRESIDLINRKYHDLKHQIAALRAEPDAERRSAWLDEMESDINTYEAQNKTGNQVLDVLLTGKSLYCQKHDIHLTTVADGTVLAGVSPMDLCTLVGNALDNAIESVKKIEDKEKRLIHVAVSRQKNFALLRFENCFEGELTFENGLPRTTKGNTDYHGYGLKSIRRTAQKYGGTVTVNTRKNWFELKILLPLAEGTQEE